MSESDPAVGGGGPRVRPETTDEITLKSLSQPELRDLVRQAEALAVLRWEVIERLTRQHNEWKAQAEALAAQLADLRGERDELKAEIEAAWFGIEHGYEIESRALITEESKTNGFKYPLAQAIHAIWKREPKVEALRGAGAALHQQWEEAAAYEAEHGNTQYAQGLDRCIDEFKAWLSLQQQLVECYRANCVCGHGRETHPSNGLAFDGSCVFCQCKAFVAILSEAQKVDQLAGDLRAVAADYGEAERARKVAEADLTRLRSRGQALRQIVKDFALRRFWHPEVARISIPQGDGTFRVYTKAEIEAACADEETKNHTRVECVPSDGPLGSTADSQRGNQ